MTFTKNKYRNQRCKIDGLMFDSKKEAIDYVLLKSRLKSKRIEHLSRQVRILLAEKKGAGCTYVADFVFYDHDRSSWVIWDSKGMETKEYQVKRAWLLDKFKGFVFVENKNGEKEYTSYGAVELNFEGKHNV